MPFDGIVTKCVVNELSELLIGGRLEKIFQPESDEIIINIRANSRNVKLLLSASPNYPRIHLTDAQRENPSVPPVFCMLLRKHISGGKITGITFHDYERIITILIESLSELGDITEKKLIIEIMGRYSNIILANNENKIIDAIKHVDEEVSSVREVMPARTYVFPPSQDKLNPESVDSTLFQDIKPESATMGVEKYLLSRIRGFSPLICREVCFQAGIDSKLQMSELSELAIESLITTLTKIIYEVINIPFKPALIRDNSNENQLIDFYCMEIKQYSSVEYFNSMSQVLDQFYSEKDRNQHLKQKKNDILKLLSNSIDRCNKKLSLQQEKLRDVSNRENLKLSGELILANIYNIPSNVASASLMNYYSENNDYIEIKLDENLTPQANAQRYFKQYTKAKSAFMYTTAQLEETLKELQYLDSVSHLLDNCVSPQEIDEVRQELIEQSYMNSKKKAISGKKREKASAPLKFLSSDGIDILVGKNNKQNDMLTLKMASSNDIWLHTKDVPGSHVIVRKQQQAIPDSTLLEAAIIAAYHSKAKQSSNVSIDYTMVRHVKKPAGAKPGMVIYENHKTIYVTPDEKVVDKLKI